MNDAQLVSKLDVVSILGGVSRVRELADGKATPRCRIYGVMRDTRKWSNISPDGEIHEGQALVGEFKSVNLDTGHEIYAAELYLPKSAHQAVLGRWGDRTTTLELAFEIGVLKDDKSITGYRYVVFPVLNLEPSDRMKELESSIGEVRQAQRKLKSQ